MRKMNVIMSAMVLIVAAVTAPAFAQTAPKADFAGTWTGYTLLGDNTRADLNLILEKAGDTYTGKINDDAGQMPVMEVKNVTFKDKTLLFEVDYPQESGTALIKIELKLDGETLKGSWADPDGNSNIIELVRKK